MNIIGSTPITTSNLYKGINNTDSTAQNTQFQAYMNDLQIKSDIMTHLKGVPLESVTIPANILEKMSNDKAAYTYYMNAIDEYVRGYKKYNCPGVLKMSFFITSDGRYCIRGENLILQQQIEESKEGNKSDGENRGTGTHFQDFSQYFTGNNVFQLNPNLSVVSYFIEKNKSKLRDVSHNNE